MGLFGEKTACPVCGSPGGGLLAVKIRNGVALCKECSRKVRMDKSPFSLSIVHVFTNVKKKIARFEQFFFKKGLTFAQFGFIMLLEKLNLSKIKEVR